MPFYRKNFEHLVGTKIGELTILSFDYEAKPRTKVVCKCSCGNVVKFNKYVLDVKRYCTYACFQSKMGKEKELKPKIPDYIYKVHQNIRTRCYNKNFKYFFRYGGRGISVCERWLDSVENLYLDMGERPSIKHSIERIDNDGNYEPSNCKWATHTEQTNNQCKTIWIEFDGETKTMSYWVKKFNFCQAAITHRVKNNIRLDAPKHIRYKTQNLHFYDYKKTLQSQ